MTELITGQVPTPLLEARAKVMAYVESQVRAARARQQVIVNLLGLAERSAADFGRPCTLDDINAELDRDRYGRA